MWGVYLRALIVENDLFFPEHLAYEDNFWVYALQMQLKNVAVLPQKFYHYRQQEMSTTKKKNMVYQFDRLIISDILLSYAKSKGLYDRYFDAIEFLYINVSTMNTSIVLIRTFDKPDYEKLRIVKEKLKAEFPNWSNNRFYKEKFSLKKKILMNLLMILPVSIYAKLVKCI